MIGRLKHYYHKLPHYLTYRAHAWCFQLLARWFYRRCVPQQQDAPVSIYTMGKVGTMTLLHSLRCAGVWYTTGAHCLQFGIRRYPYHSTGDVVRMRMANLTGFSYRKWLKRLPLIRYITVVREPIGRLISLYLFTYYFRFGEKIEETSLQTLLDNFPRVFEQDYYHPLVPGFFLSAEFGSFLGIDVFEHAFDRKNGKAVIERDRISVLVMKLEISDEQKAAALSDWLDRPIDITRRNTAEDKGYAHVYDEFKRRVRIPHGYAEAIYQSSYMEHFYTPEERAKYWKRWEPQLDRSISLPAWVEEQLENYHPRLFN